MGYKTLEKLEGKLRLFYSGLVHANDEAALRMLLINKGENHWSEYQQ